MADVSEVARVAVGFTEAEKGRTGNLRRGDRSKWVHFI